MSRGESGDEESRTITIGTKRARANAGTSRDSYRRIRHSPRAGDQDLRDCMPKGGNSGLEDSRIHTILSSGVESRSDVSESSIDYQISQTKPLKPTMNWNNSSQGSIRTSLRSGGDLGQNRLATGFRLQAERTSSGQASPHDVVEISDESEMDEDSEGGILLNVDASSRIDSADASNPLEISDEDGEITDNYPIIAMPSAGEVKVAQQRVDTEPSQSATLPGSAQTKPDITSPLFQVDARRGARILADLSPDDLEKQIKYTLFHLRRDRIDLSRTVICIACLCEGHTAQHCPGLLCSTCGGQTQHSSRLCPQTARCSRCGDRGHMVDKCKSKLKNTDLEPCDFCGGADHVEASCVQRFFPARTEHLEGELQLWISCAQCGCKDHLAGDCPNYGSKPAYEWSLRAYSLNNIVNLSLQTSAQARDMEARNKGLRPEGMQIKGRGAPNNQKYPKRGNLAQSDDEDDFTTRITGNRSRRSSPPRNHIRFADGDRGRRDRGRDDDYYRPQSNRPGPSDGYNNYQHSSSHGYRDRNGHATDRSYNGDRDYQGDRDYHNRRPRSRSPPRFDGDNWRPPLPRGPPPSVSLPARPAPPRNQQPQQNPNSNSSKKGRRGGANGKGGGARGVKPMPSAAKAAWNRGRL